MRFTFLSVAAAAILIAGAPQAQADTYNVDGAHTFPRFSYSHLGLSTQLSRFNKTTGTVVLDKAAKTGSVDVVIDMKSVDTGFAIFSTELQNEEFFDVAKYPTASFKSTKVVFEGDKPATVEGNLTIKGITKPVTLKVTHFVNVVHPRMKKDAIGADATVVVKRTDYNLGKYVPYVGDDVTITLSIEAIKP